MPRRAAEPEPEPVTILMPAGMQVMEKAKAAAQEAAQSAETERTKFETTASNRYLDKGELGFGGMGTVRKTRDKRLGRTVATKVLHPAAARAGATMMFVEEAQITGQLEHPNIVPVYDMGVTPGTKEPYFTMKLVSGDTLDERIKELHENRLDGDLLEQILRIMLQVCDTIAYAHERGVIHRDIKPQNIMLGSHGQIYVMDWGVALLDQGRLSGSNAPVAVKSTRKKSGAAGTIAYMAPEQAESDTSGVDARTDVFGLGATIYKIITGSAPHSGRNRSKVLEAVAAGTIPPPQERIPDIPLPPGICDIAMKAMAADPNDRYQTVDELSKDISAFLRGGGWFTTRSYEAGELIVKQGDQGDAGYIIVSGICRVYREDDGEQKRLTTLTAGDVFGEMAILNGETRTASVEAIERTTVKVVSRETFDRELGRNDWMRVFYKQLVERFMRVEAELRDGRG